MAPPNTQIVEITSSSQPSLIQHARQLLREYGQFLQARPEAAHVCFGSLERETARLPLSYEEQGGGALLAFNGPDTSALDPAGLIAWRVVPGPFSDHGWEIKRLWVRPAARGLALGGRLTQSVLDRAVVANRRAVYLDTIPAAMPEALRLYLHMGFTPCAPYAGDAVAGVTYLVKYL